jgi:hypothetical protein
MVFKYTTPPPFHQSEVLGEVPDPEFESDRGNNGIMEEEIMSETTTTRRIIRSHSIPGNVTDARATVTLSLMAQRRGNGAAKNGDEWADIDSFVMSNLHANEHAKMEFGANQTKNIFLHLARRYKEKGSLGELLEDIEVVALDRVTASEVESSVLEELILSLSIDGKAQVWHDIITGLQSQPDLVDQVVEIARYNPDAAQVAAASLNVARYSAAIEELKGLIASNAREGAFQSLLERNPWMFGGEYSARVDRRRFTRDENADFMMRRTVDNYLELIEIKRPITKMLFQYDDDHDSYYPCSEMNQVLGQVVKYLDEIDATRDTIERRGRKDEERTNKLRAKIIIGLDHDQEQVDALRLFNSHLHRIEILTFDQLRRTAERVRDHLIDILEPVRNPSPEFLIEVPF